jgi:alpha-galactosidase
MNAHQLDLVREGVTYYKTLSAMKQRAMPFFPLGFTGFGAQKAAAGLRDRNRVILAVWCLSQDTAVEVNMGAEILAAKCAYPTAVNATYTADGCSLRVEFDAPFSAAFFEIDLAQSSDQSPEA